MERTKWERLKQECSGKQLEQLKRMFFEERKNSMRNKPCICGSGRKFKACCWLFENYINNNKEL